MRNHGNQTAKSANQRAQKGGNRAKATSSRLSDDFRSGKRDFANCRTWAFFTALREKTFSSSDLIFRAYKKFEKKQ
ncbi:hypothetical protein CEXT_156981 [Caerostris extrusa]|uniref:Uncharacterized protein n=1 Tax=Caerostris extrusa TaxID=172846 RepID=A0AAV4P029_CAEEX|nr:hypothetical protein CEXT_156981 [Caerostris extrusa]